MAMSKGTGVWHRQGRERAWRRGQGHNDEGVGMADGSGNRLDVFFKNRPGHQIISDGLD